MRLLIPPLALVAIHILGFMLSGCATHRTSPKSRVECYRGDEKASYSRDYTRKDGCSVVVEKNGVILKDEAEAIKMILDGIKGKIVVEKQP